ncbi:Protein kinase domain-containing protein [Cinnamomum micranthum f. kanehirae]|uniref:non-specific serine/threonine protein kinase n=1 Tax=Cinnamomum micranthum f. kanehirae TaxID=337451 RepID=A0A3S3MWD7_9MAGN|nr:Protein kinase domain-containing protein [Cinnamomum micranthum f. kanehirae]
MQLPNTIPSRRLFAKCSLFHVAFLVICIKLLSFAEAASATPLRNESDRLALLAIKGQISDGPNGILSSWNHSLHFCMWGGVTCSRRHPQRVIALNLRSQNLAGYLSPHIGNLSFLRNIELPNNSFQGQIPPEIGRLRRLRFFHLGNNSFNGEIPSNLSQCSELELLGLYRNKIAGKILPELGSLSNLKLLDLNVNYLIGHIPPSLGNLSSLYVLDLSFNDLYGNIPHDLGQLLKLEVLQLVNDQLSGTIPSSLYNLSSLTAFNLAGNNLHGTIPPDFGINLPNIQWFSLGDNQLEGPIPYSLSNASRIVHLDFDRNRFRGSVPMNLENLQALLRFNLGGNQLGGEKDDMNFITSLTNCSNLFFLVLANNRFSGVLPSSIANLSSQLTYLHLGYNQISGTIPSGIENLANLKYFVMGENHFTGSIPIHLGKLQKLEAVGLFNNTLSGQIPESIGNLTRLYRLNLDGNDLQGSIPWSLRNCQHLEELSLARNNLHGTIPKQLLYIPPLRMLFVDTNSLSGPLPLDIDGLKNLEILDVSDNKFSGEIPSTLGTCTHLEFLYMKVNSFQGNIPSSLSSLKGLQELDLSHNNLSGQIPIYLEEFLFLQYLNVSFNDLEGVVPVHRIFQNASALSIQGNRKLCGGITKLGLPPCSKLAPKKHKKALPLIGIVISSVVVVLSLFLLSYFLAHYWLKKSSKKSPIISSMGERFLEVTYAELLKATDGFSSANLIGVGSFGFVYKGILDQIGLTAAIKVLKLQQHRAPKSFVAECKALRSIRHRNVVKILSVCSSIDFTGNDFKALVFEYMPNGSLDTWLHPNEEKHNSTCLNFIQRLNVAIDVASALDYLHHNCEAPVVHCDLKPSNVLLDEDMVAHVGDFGLARIFSKDVGNCSQTQSSSIGIKGSIGYVAPEYGMGGEVSTYGDVYSYGILLLEMFTGKRPTDDVFKDNLNLHQLAKMAFPERVIEIIDQRLLLEGNVYISSNEDYNEMRSRMHECLLSLVRISISCSVEAPKERSEMRDVMLELQGVKDFYLGVNKYKAKEKKVPMSLEGISMVSTRLVIGILMLSLALEAVKMISNTSSSLLRHLNIAEYIYLQNAELSTI